jgi:hypothetical protein
MSKDTVIDIDPKKQPSLVNLPRVPSGVMMADEADEIEMQSRKPTEGVPPATGEDESHGGPENVEIKMKEVDGTRKGLTAEEAKVNFCTDTWMTFT